MCLFAYNAVAVSFLIFFSGLRFVDRLDRLTGVMDTEKSRYTGHSEHYSRLIVGA